MDPATFQLDYARRQVRWGRVRVRYHAGGAVITLRPDAESIVVGLLATGCLLTLGACTLVLTALSFAGRPVPSAEGVLLLMVALFLVVVLGFLLLSTGEFFRPVTLRCEASLLCCERPLLLGTRRRSWRPEAVRGFRAARYQLFLIPAEGGDQSLLEGVRESERPALGEALAVLYAWLGRPVPAEPLPARPGAGGRP